MILGFSTQLKGKPTYFVEKISKCLKSILFKKYPPIAFPEQCIHRDFDYVAYAYVKPKHHTIREDKNNRWIVGTNIDFFINARQKNMFRFAPVLPVVSIQKIEIKWYNIFDKKIVRVIIDNESYDVIKFEKELIVTVNMLQLANNDGFDTIDAFFAYFDKDFTGKIIHWTALRY